MRSRRRSDPGRHSRIGDQQRRLRQGRFSRTSVTGQARVVSEALAISGVRPGDVSYVEAHGTGTLIGDPIEVAALTQAFRAETDKTQFCAIGSLKSNIGHTGEASGICRLHQDRTGAAESPDSAEPALRDAESAGGFRRTARSSSTPSCAIGQCRPASCASPASRRSARAAPTATSSSKKRRRRAPRRAPGRTSCWCCRPRVRARSIRLRSDLAAHLRATPDANLADEAFTLLSGRKGFSHRRALVAASVTTRSPRSSGRHQAVDHPAHQTATAPAINFMFPGGGAQYARMGADLYEHEPAYREAFDEALSAFEPALRADIRSLVFAEPEHAAAAAPASRRRRAACPRCWPPNTRSPGCWRPGDSSRLR